MTRLANIEKAGFFPLPPVVTDLIMTYLATPHRGRVLDPCTGEGVALLALADKLGLEPFGVELHEGRAKMAQELVQQWLVRRLQTSRTAVLPQLPSRRVLHDGYMNLITTKGGYNLLYLNPPYDHDDEDGRLEYQWLKLCRPHLQPGGVLVWVVPQHLLKFAPAARYISGWYERVQVFRFPDPEYAQFRQVVLFGVLRPRPIPPDSELVEKLAILASGMFPLPVLTPAEEPTYTLPPLKVADKQFIFRSWMIDPDEALAEVREHGAWTTSAWREHLDASTNHVPLRPLTPLKIGHMSSVIAAGHLNNQVLTTSPESGSRDNSSRLLIKGRSYKTVRQSSFSEPLPDGKTRITYLDTEQVVTDITSVTGDGQVVSYKGPELEAFLQQWISPLTDLVAQSYPPVYQFNLNGYGSVLNSLSRGRVIPGLNGQTGLLPAQKHAAAAALTRLEKARDCIVVGEMGVGKAQPLDAKVLTPSGWKCMGNIQEGDEVVNPDGGTAFVVGVYPQGRKDIYRVTFSDGSQTECCDEHLWQVITPLRKWRDGSSQVLSLQDMRYDLFSKSGNARYFIPIVRPVVFESQELPVDPYLLGALIGDGTLGCNAVLISSMDDEIITEVSNALPEGIVVSHQSATTFRIARGRNSDNRKFILPQNTLLNAIRELGLSGKRAESKFIPQTYLFADVPARIALLQGLLDTDGTIDPRSGKISFCTISEQLAIDVVALIQSLGGVARTRTRYTKYTHNGEKRVGRLSYQIGVSLPNAIQPFRLSRKQQYVIPRTKYGITRALVKVKYIGQKEAQCIALDSENQLYVTDNYIVTHNTTVGIGIAAGLNARRTIILCPPHLVDKWQREARIVWPGVRAMALETISDVDAFFGDQPASAPLRQSSGQALIGVVKQTTARSASGWEHAYDLIGPASHRYGSSGFDEVSRAWGEVSSPINLLDLPAEQRQWRGRVLSQRQIMALQGQGVCCPVCGEQQMNRDVPLSVREFKSATRRCDNLKCRSPLYQFSRNRSASQRRGSFLLYVEREKLIRQYTNQGEEVPYTIRERWTGATVRDTFGYGKVPLSAYIKHRARGRLDLALIDEAHQYKGIDSDQGYAMHHLAQSARKVVALTGTVYGGKASSLFYLLFRLSPEMNQVYVDRDETGQRRVKHKEWITAYGILQTIETVTLDEDGKQTANSRANARMKELPGGSPAMLPWLLNRSVFLSLGDMGFPLPEYTEIPVSIPMAPEQEELYETLKEQLKEELKERLVKGDKSLLAGYLYALLFWPDSPRRGKVVTCPRDGKVVASIPGLPDEFVGPKERAIIELCRKEKAQGRRVLLLCGQTDTLDIQPEWKQMLAQAGLKAAILRAEPNKREKWVEQQVQAGVDVLISHPRKVETGLDLLSFQTIVWMAVDYSVYTVLQASRRSWRIGQTEPVKVYFYAYESSLQEEALRLVAAKVAAALRVNGDTIADDSLAELDELSGGDIVTTLARIVTGEVQVSAQSLQQAFAEANAGLRQANQLIGEYSIVDAAAETPTLLPVSPLITDNGHSAPPPLVNGHGHHNHQPSLFTPYAVPAHDAAANGATNNGLTLSSPPTNGIMTPATEANGHTPINGKDGLSLLTNGHYHDLAIPSDEPPGPVTAPKPVIVPRPQLLTRLLARQ